MSCIELPFHSYNMCFTIYAYLALNQLYTDSIISEHKPTGSIKKKYIQTILPARF